MEKIKKPSPRRPWYVRSQLLLLQWQQLLKKHGCWPTNCLLLDLQHTNNCWTTKKHTPTTTKNIDATATNHEGRPFFQRHLTHEQQQQPLFSFWQQLEKQNGYFSRVYIHRTRRSRNVLIATCHGRNVRTRDHFLLSSCCCENVGCCHMIRRQLASCLSGFFLWFFLCWPELRDFFCDFCDTNVIFFVIFKKSQKSHLCRKITKITTANEICANDTLDTWDAPQYRPVGAVLSKQPGTDLQILTNRTNNRPTISLINNLTVKQLSTTVLYNEMRKPIGESLWGKNQNGFRPWRSTTTDNHVLCALPTIARGKRGQITQNNIANTLWIVDTTNYKWPTKRNVFFNLQYNKWHTFFFSL